ncbi:MAG: sigma 54-interacting transcriptional regulator, partial [Deltaproteobacteria bacterium]|nr:sigma 54-interacting transcriptional regulator [Deltaproteobacteria bacterium]
MDTQTSSMRSAHRGPDLPRGLTGRREELMLPRPEHGRAAGAGSQLEVVRTTGDQERRPADERALALTWTHEGEEQRCVLGQGVLTIGAHGSNSIQLADRCVSRFHARVHRRTDGQLWLRDLGSRNGTFVDGLRVTESALACGARLRVGGTELRLEPAEAPSMHGVRGFDARDPALASALALLRRAAPSRVPVLLFGESGTGKEVAARALHELSPRAQGPLVPVNCGAIAAELAESELFGHERGAFTGAVTSSMGAFGAAEGGTLFL